MRSLVSSYGERVLIGEAWLPFDRLMEYYGASLDGFHLPFNFHLIGTRWDAPALRRVIGEYEALLPKGAWPNWVLGNHDRSRIASRVGAAQAALKIAVERPPVPPTLAASQTAVIRSVPPHPASSEPLWRAALAAALALAVLLGTALVFLALRTEQEEVTVAGFEWRRTIEVEACTTVRGEDWAEQAPAGARILWRAPRLDTGQGAQGEANVAVRLCEVHLLHLFGVEEQSEGAGFRFGLSF